MISDNNYIYDPICIKHGDKMDCGPGLCGGARIYACKGCSEEGVGATVSKGKIVKKPVYRPKPGTVSIPLLVPPKSPPLALESSPGISLGKIGSGTSSLYVPGLLDPSTGFPRPVIPKTALEKLPAAYQQEFLRHSGYVDDPLSDTYHLPGHKTTHRILGSEEKPKKAATVSDMLEKHLKAHTKAMLEEQSILLESTHLAEDP